MRQLFLVFSCQRKRQHSKENAQIIFSYNWYQFSTYSLRRSQVSIKIIFTKTQRQKQQIETILAKIKRSLSKIAAYFVVRTWLSDGEGLRSPVFALFFLVITFKISGTREVVFTLSTTPITRSESSCSRSETAYILFPKYRVVSALSSQSAWVFPKMGFELGKFRARRIWEVCYFWKLPSALLISILSFFWRIFRGHSVYWFYFRPCSNHALNDPQKAL